MRTVVNFTDCLKIIDPPPTTSLLMVSVKYLPSSWEKDSTESFARSVMEKNRFFATSFNTLFVEFLKKSDYLIVLFLLTSERIMRVNTHVTFLLFN